MAKNIINISEDLHLLTVKSFMKRNGYLGNINNEDAVNYALKFMNSAIDFLDEETLNNLKP